MDMEELQENINFPQDMLLQLFFQSFKKRNCLCNLFTILLEVKLSTSKHLVLFSVNRVF